VEQPQSNLPVQVVLYASQTQLVSAACKYALAHDKKMATQIENGLQDLAEFFDAVAANPRAWPVEGRMARSLKVRMRKLKGERERPKPMGRQARAKRRKEAHRERRRTRGAEAIAFNAERARNEVPPVDESRPSALRRLLGG
jgi:hypothetical protein